MSFTPFSSQLSLGFWAAFRAQKLEHWALDTPAAQTTAVLQFQASSNVAVWLDGINDTRDTSEPEFLGTDSLAVPATVLHTNSLEEFKALPWAAQVQDACRGVLQDIVSGAAAAHPGKLMPVLCSVFCHMKTHKAVHWMNMPALNTGADVLASTWSWPEPQQLPLRSARTGCAVLYQRGSAGWAVCTPAEVLADVSEAAAAAQEHRLIPVIWGKLDAGSMSLPWHAQNILAAWGIWLADAGAATTSFTVALGLPVPRPGADGLAWHVDTAHLELRQVHVPVLYTVPWASLGDAAASSLPALPELPPGSCTGLEPHPSGTVRPRSVNLANAFSPAALAAQAENLNLSLMKWRLAPQLQQAALSKLRVLLIGAGTLGCHVARGLFAWGVRSVTLVDGGRVALSNPVRQPLFTSAQASDGQPKAAAAAASLGAITATSQAVGEMLSVPMPGHVSLAECSTAALRAMCEQAAAAEPSAVLDALKDDAAGAATARSLARLEELMLQHDVVYLLTDTRESRWLPSLLAAVHSIPLFNVALGFDGWLVQRHGVQVDGKLSGACYFCSDVIGPADTLTGRSLDQQCTVTRPGVAAVSSAIAVELMVSVMHGAAGWATPHADSGPFGATPQLLRGGLGGAATLCAATAPFPSCTGCGQGLRHAVRQHGHAWILLACAEGREFIEAAAGVHELAATAAALHDGSGDDFGWSSDDSDAGDEA